MDSPPRLALLRRSIRIGFVAGAAVGAALALWYLVSTGGERQEGIVMLDDFFSTPAGFPVWLLAARLPEAVTDFGDAMAMVLAPAVNGAAAGALVGAWRELYKGIPFSRG